MIKNAILNIITLISFGLIMVFISILDSANIKIPLIGIAICMTWIYLYYMANKDSILKDV